MTTLDDAKAHMNITTTTNDVELASVLAGAIALAESFVGPIELRSVTETHYAVNTDRLVLRRLPAVSVTSIAIRASTGSTPTVYLTDSLLLDPDVGVLRMMNGWPLYGDVTVVYVAGRTLTPPAVHRAILAIVKADWSSQRGARPLPGSGEGDAATPYYPGAGTGLSPLVIALLQPHHAASAIA